MVLTPFYKITGDVLFNGVSSVTISDSIANESDSLTIECEDFKALKEDAKVEIFIGYKERGLWSVGSYNLQSVRFTPISKILLFTSAEFNKEFKKKRTISYQKLTIKELIAKIANRHSLKYKCNMEQYLEHIDQRNESDLALLNRIANKYNAIFNIKNKTLVFLEKDSKELPEFTILAKDAKDWSIELNNRFRYNSIQVKYQDIRKNKKEIIKVGDSEPIYYIETTYNNKTEAINVATAKFKELLSKTRTGTVTIEGVNVVAGSKVDIIGFNTFVDGKYLINNVEHSIRDIFITTIILEKV